MASAIRFVHTANTSPSRFRRVNLFSPRVNFLIWSEDLVSASKEEIYVSVSAPSIPARLWPHPVSEWPRPKVPPSLSSFLPNTTKYPFLDVSDITPKREGGGSWATCDTGWTTKGPTRRERERDRHDGVRSCEAKVPFLPLCLDKKELFFFLPSSSIPPPSSTYLEVGRKMA